MDSTQWNWNKLIATYDDNYPKTVADAEVNILQAHFGKSPSIQHIKEGFGKAAPKYIVQRWTIKLDEFYGKGMLKDDQIDEISTLVCVRYADLRLTELAIFFNEFKLGEFGTIYGKIDPITITKALASFFARRNDIIDRHNREISQKAKDEEIENWNRTGITLDEFLKRRGLKFNDVLPNMPGIKL